MPTSLRERQKVGLFLMGKKGCCVLQSLIDQFGSTSIAFVCAALDRGVNDDSFAKIKETAVEHGIAIFGRGRLPECSSSSVGYRFAVGWKWIIEDTNNLVVFHDSLLPKYRGFAPLPNMLVDGQSEIGVTALFADDDYDCGPVIAQKRIGIRYPKRVEDAINDLIPMYCDLALDIADRALRQDAIAAVPQNDRDATYSMWRDDADYFIDWSSSSEAIKRFVDAVSYPYRGAASRVNEALVRVFDGVPLEDVVIEDRQSHLGKVIFMREGMPVVVCGSGLLWLTDLRGDDGKPWVGLPFRSRFAGIS